jgi:hypothetical protein
MQSPINVNHLLPVLDSKLIELLKSLTPDEWQKQTIAKLWVVKDVVSHLLDGNIRGLSILRDTYFGEKPDIKSYQDLIDFLNRLNADWVKATKRVSPEMLIILHQLTGKMYCDYCASLNPFDKAALSVAWAGEEESKNWMHLAREYTEKWLHQQQIRDAVNKPALMTREFFYPFIDIFMMGLPHTYRNVTAENGTTIKLIITTEIGGAWYVTHLHQKWVLSKEDHKDPAATISIEPDLSWKLFSKSIRPEHVRNEIHVEGNQQLAEVALSMVSVMA